jgi:ABC-2 type transport system ATP-binding protein
VTKELAVEAHGLVKRFGDTAAIDKVSIAVEAGAVRGLLGRNGAGKTTLFRILFGLLPPDSGSLRLLGRDAEPGDVHARRGVAGFVEEARFYPYLSARRNLELLNRLDGTPSANGIDEALEAVGLADRSEQKVGNFSTGMRQRLGLAAALVRRPRLLLLDEPTIGLDPAGARSVRALVRELAGHGVTVFLSSHNMVEVDEICDSAVIIDRGRVVWDGTLERLRNEAPAPLYHLSTSDDRRALQVALGRTEIEVTRNGIRRLSVRGEDKARDEYVVTLARAGVAVRHLEPAVSPLEALFAELTGDPTIDAPGHT